MKDEDIWCWGEGGGRLNDVSSLGPPSIVHQNLPASPQTQTLLPRLLLPPPPRPAPATATAKICQKINRGVSRLKNERGMKVK